MRKKMKNVAAMVLGVALTGAVLTGCGESPQPSQDTQQAISNSISEETGQDSDVENEEVEGTEKTEETSGGYEDNFAVDSEAAKEFAGKVKDAVAQKDLEALADLTVFPVYVGLPDVGVVETREDFLNLDAEAVFTEELLDAIETADIDNFQPSMAGFPIFTEGKQTSINFGVVDGVLAINGINY